MFIDWPLILITVGLMVCAHNVKWLRIWYLSYELVLGKAVRRGEGPEVPGRFRVDHRPDCGINRAFGVGHRGRSVTRFRGNLGGSGVLGGS